MTAILLLELKNGSNGSSSRSTRPVAGRQGHDARPALLIEDATKRFMVGRKRKPVTAI